MIVFLIFICLQSSLSLYGMLPPKMDAITFKNKMEQLLPADSIHKALAHDQKRNTYCEYYFTLQKLYTEERNIYISYKLNHVKNFIFDNPYENIEIVSLEIAHLLNLHPSNSFQLVANCKRMYDNKEFCQDYPCNALENNEPLTQIIQQFPPIVQKIAIKHINRIETAKLCYILYSYLPHTCKTPKIMDNPFEDYVEEIGDSIGSLLDSYYISPQTIHKEAIAFCNSCCPLVIGSIKNNYNEKIEKLYIEKLYNYLPVKHYFAFECRNLGYTDRSISLLIKSIHGMLSQDLNNPFKNNGQAAFDLLQSVVKYLQYSKKRAKDVYLQFRNIYELHTFRRGQGMQLVVNKKTTLQQVQLSDKEPTANSDLDE